MPDNKQKPPKPLSEMTEKERQTRLIERFTWDSADIVWETNPDDVPDDIAPIPDRKPGPH
jgi:hypothetical protein